MNSRSKYVILTLAALVVSIIPPLATTVYFFPIWIETSAEATLSGTVCVLALICLIPFGKYVVQLMRSPSAPLVWGIFTLIMFVMRSIAAEMFVVGVVGTAANVVGMMIFKLRGKPEKEE